MILFDENIIVLIFKIMIPRALLIIAILYSCCITVFMRACQQNENFEQMEESSYAIRYADSAYLEIEGNLNDAKILWGNKDVYTRALKRMEQNVLINSNRFESSMKNGRELNVSENLFNHFVSKWDYWNKLLEKGDKVIVRNKLNHYSVVNKTEAGDTAKWKKL